MPIMELLQYLIVPGSEAHAQWSRLAYQSIDPSQCGLSGWMEMRDAVQDRSRASSVHQSSMPGSGCNGIVENSKIAEAEDIDHDLLRSLLSNNSSFVPENNAPPNAARELPTNRQVPSQSQKVCFHWYHNNHCKRDPNNPNPPEKPCKYLHQLEKGQKDVKLALFPRWMHKTACGLEFCPMKDSDWKPKDKSTATKEIRERQSTIPEEHKASAVSQQPKRRFSMRHPDEPAYEPYKRRRIVYEEDSSAEEDDEQKNTTCFFWYHGHCARIFDARTNYTCPFRHDLTDPPKMIEQPPDYIHAERCGLEWCAADAEQREQGVSTPVDVELRPSRRESSEVGATNEGMRNGGRRSKKAKSKSSKRTCFFWYHGHCSRGESPGGSPCAMRHELQDPPRMVKPPPGYVHREPCDREWCPGDAETADDGFEKRYFEDRTVDGNMGDLISDNDDEEQEWFLRGFDNC